MSEEPTTPADIEAKLAQTREQMTSTVDELVGQLDPRKQAKEMAGLAKDKAAEASEVAKDTVAKAKAGDSQAIAVVAGVAGGALLLAGLIARRIFSRG